MGEIINMPIINLRNYRIGFLNGTAHFKKCKQLFVYQHLLLLGDIWWSKFESIFKYCSFFSTPELIRNPWQLKTAVFLHWCLLCAVPLRYRYWELSYRIFTIFPGRGEKFREYQVNKYNSIQITNSTFSRYLKIILLHVSVLDLYTIFVIKMISNGYFCTQNDMKLIVLYSKWYKIEYFWIKTFFSVTK